MSCMSECVTITEKSIYNFHIYFYYDNTQNWTLRAAANSLGFGTSIQICWSSSIFKMNFTYGFNLLINTRKAKPWNHAIFQMESSFAVFSYYFAFNFIIQITMVTPYTFIFMFYSYKKVIWKKKLSLITTTI